MAFQLQTDRLLLRDAGPADESALISYFAEPEAQPQILKTQKGPEWVQNCIRAASHIPPLEQRSHFWMAVEVKATRELCGVCSLIYAEPGSTYAVLGWHLAQSHSGKGYATESARELLRLAFEQKGVRLVRADCFADNPKAQRVFSKLGMKQQQLSRFRRWWMSTNYGEDKPIVRYTINADVWCQQSGV